MHFQILHLYQLNVSPATSTGGTFQSTLPTLPTVSQFWRFPFEVSNRQMDIPMEGNWSVTPTRVLGAAKCRAPPLSDQCHEWSLREHLQEPQGSQGLPSSLLWLMGTNHRAGHKHPLLCNWKDNYLKFVLPALESPALLQVSTAGTGKPRSWQKHSLGMALNSLPFPGSETVSSAVSLKSSSSDCPGQVLWLFVPLQGAIRMSFLMAHPKPKHPQKCSGVSTDPLTFVWFPQSHLGSWFCLAPHFVHLWTSLPNRQHKWVLLHTGCWTDFCKQPLVYIQCLTSGMNSQVKTCTQFYKIKKEKLLVWVILRRDPGLCKLLPSHGSGITAYDESSLLTVHHKTFSEILCPKLCIWLFGLFGDLVWWEI